MPLRNNLIPALLIGGAVGVLVLTPRSAVAACNVTVTGSVNCKADTATADRTNTNGTHATSSARQQLFNNGAAIDATVHSGVTVSGFGLRLTQDSANPLPVTISNQGSITSATAASTLRLHGNGGLVSYFGNGSITNAAAAGTGLAVDNVGGDVSIATGSGAISGATAIKAGTTAGGAVTITTGSGPVAGSVGNGIGAKTTNGPLSVTVGSGGVTSNSDETAPDSNAYAIGLSSTGGNIVVTANGNVSGSANCTAFPGCISGGVHAISNGSGNITIDGSGTYAAPSRGRPIFAEQSTTGLGGILVTGSGATVEGSPTFGNSSAIRGEIHNPADSSNIVINRSGDITAYDTFAPPNINSISADIHAFTVGSGNITVAGGAGATLSNTGMFGIEASANSADSTGSINVSTGAQSTVKVNGSGLFADNSAIAIPTSAGSTITVTANGTINSGAILNPVGGFAGEGGGSVATPAGILAGYNGAPTFGPASGPYTSCGPFGCTTLAPNPNVNGTVTVVNNAIVNAAGGNGIFAFNFGNGNVSVTSSGPITVTGATAQNGIEAFSAEIGNIAISNSTNVTAANGSGILTNSAGTGTTTVTLTAGTIQGATSGVTATSANGPIQISNGATIQNLSGHANDQAVATSGSGSATLTSNTGAVVTGTIAMTGTASNEFTNGGTWNTFGSSMFAGASSVDNNGTLNVLGTTTFSGLETLTNGGTLNLAASASATTTLTLAGNLAFKSGALYIVALSPASSALTNVGGTASLAGAVQAVLLPGAYSKRSYTILHSGGLDGTTFSGVTLSGFGTGFTGTLAYTPTDVLLSLAASLGSGGGLNANQQSVATALNNFFNSGGTLSPNFLPIFGLTGGNLATALSQLDGEAVTDGKIVAFQAMSNFLGLMLDPFVDGHGGARSGGQAIGFAPEEESSLPPDVALAYNAVLKAAKSDSFALRWTTWGAAYGGSSTTNGDPIIGTNTVTSHIYGFAAGIEQNVAPGMVLGFALAGGDTNWGLAQGLGGGRSDIFQAGIYSASHFGPAYVAGALAFANNWMTTNRLAPLGDQLTASFNAQSYGGRLEAGYRYAVLPAIGVAPYAALQAQSFSAPNYSETDLTGGGFGLNYSATTATDTRSELGARFDDATMLGTMPLTLRASVAWAHDWVSNPALGAVFQTLPGAAFTVNGVAPPKDSALASAAAELRLGRNWTLATKFDGEIAPGSQTYAGTGTLRYSW